MSHADLRKLNALRIQAGKGPLKAWKESKAKLIAEIEKYQRTAQSAGQYLDKNGEPVPVTVCPPPAELAKEHKRSAEIDRVVQKRLNGVDVVKIDDSAVGQPMAEKLKAARTATKTRAKSTGDAMSLADIAREINIDPKIARAKMRRVNAPAGSTVGKYLYKANFVDAIKAILTGKK